MEETRARLVEKLTHLIREPGRFPTAIEGFHLTRWNEANQTDTCFYSPAIGVILQGRKEAVIGSETLRYGEFDCLVNGVDMPSLSTIIAASPEQPLLAVSLDIDRTLATELAAEISPVPNTASAHYLGVSVAKVTPDVLEAFSRLLDVLGNPEHRALIAPLVVREIITRVLMGPQGGALRMIYTLGSHSNQIAEAITWLRANYEQPLHITELADKVGMATSTFHRQFKNVTSLSPLQFQKYLRLYEAQRLMLSEDKDANTAGRIVGYGNLQQFNREYKRLFGEPPLRNVKQLRRE